MSWVTPQALTAAIQRTYLEKTSRAADYQHLDGIIRTAINAGDCLAEIAASRFTSQGAEDQQFAFVAALMLERMVEANWRTCESFSDKPMVLRALRGAINQPEGPPKIRESFFRCLSHICVAEFPSPFWEMFLDECTQFLEQASTWHPKFVLTCAQIASKNDSLWRWMLSALLVRVPHPDYPCNSYSLELLGSLLENKRCSLVKDVLPWDRMKQIERILLAVAPQELSQILSAPQSIQEFSRFLVQSHTVVRVTMENVSAVLIHTMSCLHVLKDSFLLHRRELPDCVSQLVVELLETVQLILNTRREAFSVAPPASVFTLLFWFLGETDDNELDDEGRMVRWMFEEDSVPAGCASGDACALAGSVIQQFIECNEGHLLPFAQQWNAAATSAAAGAHPALWFALANALEAACRQCAMDGISILDSVPPELLFDPLWIPLKAEVPLLSARYLHLATDLVELTHNVPLCRTLFHYAAVMAQQRGAGTFLQPVAVFALGKILCSSTEVMGDLVGELSPGMIDAAVVAASTGTTLGVCCCVYALTIMVELSEESAAHLWRFHSLTDCMGLAVSRCSRGSFAQRIVRFGRELWDSHLKSKERCPLFGAMCETILRAVRAAGHASCSARCIVDLMQYTGLQCNCACRGVLRHLADFVQEFAVMWGPHDDAQLRSLSSSIGSCLVAFATDPIPGLWSAAQHLVQETATRSTVTFSIAALSLGLSCVQAGGLSADSFFDYCRLFHRMTTQANDFNLMGGLLPIAVTLTFRPQILLDAIPQPPLRELLHRVLSWWTSLCTHCDRRTQKFTFAAWTNLVRSDEGSGMNSPVRLFLQSPIVFHRISSVYGKSNPSFNVSVSDAMGLALVSVLRSPTNQIRLVNFASSDAFRVFDLSHVVPGTPSWGELAANLLAQMQRQLLVGPTFEEAALACLRGDQ